MKTEQEIRQMVNTCNLYHSCNGCPCNPEDISRFIGDRWKGGCPNYDRKLVYAMGKGYGDISEYKAEIERLKADYAELQTNAEILACGVRDLNHENYELTKKLTKQTRIARDANAKYTGAVRYLKPFQYKVDRLETKCDDLKKLSDWQREEIKRLKAEVNKGCDNCETVNQAKIDVLNELKKKKSIAIWDIDEMIKELENENSMDC